MAVSENYTVTEIEDTVNVCFAAVMTSETYMAVIVTRDVSAIGMLILLLEGHTMCLINIITNLFQPTLIMFL